MPLRPGAKKDGCFCRRHLIKLLVTFTLSRNNNAILFRNNNILILLYIVLGSRDIINGEEYINDYDGYDGPGDPKRLRPKKHKAKKAQRYCFVTW